jgi:hypothetical protein
LRNARTSTFRLAPRTRRWKNPCRGIRTAPCAPARNPR